MKNRWFRIVVFFGVALSILVLGLPAALSAYCENDITAYNYYDDGYYEDYQEESYNKDTDYNDYYSKDSYYKGTYYNDYYNVYRYGAYKYAVYYYLKTLLERFPLLEKILANLLCLD